ncbi:hypothetical protein HDU98_002381 [Podochytrium sp. JEL0797]|nr:hypothetical protein HDU98_002381 [Podochytrium sp. JEL0797]
MAPSASSGSLAAPVAASSSSGSPANPSSAFAAPSGFPGRPGVASPSSRHNNNAKTSQREKKAAARKASSLSLSSSNQQEDYELMLTVLAPPSAQTTQPTRRHEISLTHLVNFSFPAREQPSTTPIRRKKSSLHHVPFNKEKFINANYRFILKPAPYKRHLQNPDLPLPWAHILQVIIPHPLHTHPHCPICLNPPTAPRVTRCGHVFCLPCLLRYLDVQKGTATASAAGEYGTCPVCLEYVYAKDVKSCAFLGYEVWKDGYEAACMVLMKRGLTSTIALPKSTWTSPDLTPPSVTSFHLPYSHLLLATQASHTLHLTTALTTLLSLRADLVQEERMYRTAATSQKAMYLDLAAQSAAETRFVDAACAVVRHQLEIAGQMDWEVGEDEEVNVVPGYAVGKGGKPARAGSKTRVGAGGGGGKKAGGGGGGAVRKASVDGIGEVGERGGRSLVASGDGDGHGVFEKHRGRAEVGGTSPERTPRASRSNKKQSAASQPAASTTSAEAFSGLGTPSVNARTGQPSAEFFYFYQAQDGQHMYLHPLEIKILKHEFGEYEMFPGMILAKVVNVQESTMTEDLRKKCRYMSHLPLSCDVNFCELDLSNIVSPETLAVFEKELKHRAQEHHRRHQSTPSNTTTTTSSSSIKKNKGKATHPSTSTSSSSSSSTSLDTSPISYHPSIDTTTSYHHQQRPESQEISSSWEDPSLFNVLFPAAVPSTTNPTTPTTPTIHLHGTDESAPLRPTRTIPHSTSSFASAALKGSTRPLTSTAPHHGSRFSTLQNDSESDTESREYRYVEEAWAVDLEESLIRERKLEEGEEGGVNAVVGGRKGKGGKKKKAVMLVSNGGRRGGV